MVVVGADHEGLAGVRIGAGKESRDVSRLAPHRLDGGGNGGRGARAGSRADTAGGVAPHGDHGNGEAGAPFGVERGERIGRAEEHDQGGRAHRRRARGGPVRIDGSRVGVGRRAFDHQDPARQLRVCGVAGLCSG